MVKDSNKTDYLILGGGAFGLSTALHISLQYPNANVKILDKSSLPCPVAASTDINKIVRMDYGSDSTDIYSKLAESSIKTWKKWNKEFGKDIYNENSCLILSEGECKNKSETFENCTVRKLESMGYKTTWLEKDQGNSVKERVRLLPGEERSKEFLSSWNDTRLQITDGYYNPHGGWVNSSLGVEVMRSKCVENGVKFSTGKSGEFKKFIEGPNGKVNGIEASDGTLHHSNLTIVCCGAWASAIVPELDGLVEATGHTIIKFKIPKEFRYKYSSENFSVWWYDVETKGYYGFPVNEDGIMKVSNHSKGFLNPQKSSDGRVTSIPKTDSKTNNLIPKVAWDHHSKFLSRAFPQMHRENWEIESFRICWYADSWDNHFYFDHVPNREGLFVATGDSGHGMKFAPEIGKVILECIERKDGKYYNQFKWRPKPKDFKLYIDRCEVDYSELPLDELEWIRGGKRFGSKI